MPPSLLGPVETLQLKLLAISPLLCHQMAVVVARVIVVHDRSYLLIKSVMV